MSFFVIVFSLEYWFVDGTNQKKRKLICGCRISWTRQSSFLCCHRSGNFGPHYCEYIVHANWMADAITVRFRWSSSQPAVCSVHILCQFYMFCAFLWHLEFWIVIWILREKYIYLGVAGKLPIEYKTCTKTRNLDSKINSLEESCPFLSWFMETSSQGFAK